MEPTEHQIEVAIIKYLKHHGYDVFKFKDQARRINGSYQKSKHEINGVSDLCVLLSGGTILWLEVKTNAGKQSESQAEFQALIEKNGGKYAIARNPKVALEIVQTLDTPHVDSKPLRVLN